MTSYSATRATTSGATPTGVVAGVAALLVVVVMGQIDMFVVNLAGPAIQRSLGADFGQAQFVIDAYVAAYAAGLVTWGRLGDRVGARRVLLAGLAGFTLGSLLCALAPTPATLIASRALQGIGASAMAPQVLSLLRHMFPDPERRDRALSAYGSAIGFGVVAGLAGGGLLLHADVAGLGWRALFLVNVPVGIAAVAAIRYAVPERPPLPGPRLDVGGAALTALVLPALLLPPALLAEQETPTRPLLCLAVAVLLCAALVRQQRRTQQRRGAEPLFAPDLLGDTGFRRAMVVVCCFYAGNAGLFLVFTYHLQAGLGLGQLAAGLVFVPLGVGFLAGSAVSGRFGNRGMTFGGWVMTACLLGAAASVLAPVDGQPPLLAVVVGVSGFGQGLVVARLVSAVLARVPSERAGSGAGVLHTVTQASMALGVVVAGALYRLVLGADPVADPSGAPLLGDATAFAATTVLLAAAATAVAVRTRRLNPA